MNIEELIASVLNVPVSLITDSTSPVTLPVWDSLKHLELIETIQEVYQVTLTTREIHRITSVADIRQILQQKI